MEEKNYLTEAFRAFEDLTEDIFDISIDNGLEQAKAFEEEPVQELEIIYDPLVSEDEEKIKDSYLGKAILQCEICQSMLYKDPSEVIIDEEAGLANVEEACPYCQSEDGFKVIGQVAEFCKDCKEDEEEHDEDAEIETSEEEIKVDETEKFKIEESVNEYDSKADIIKKARLGFNKAKRILEKKYPSIDIGKLFIDEDSIEAENESSITTFSIFDDQDIDKALKLMADPKNYVWFGPDAIGNDELSSQWEYMEFDDEYEEKYPKAYDIIDSAGLHLIGFDDEDVKNVEPEFLIYVNSNIKESLDDIDADADNKKELAKRKFAKAQDDADSDRDYKLKKDNLKESDKPAAISIEDAQKWVDYDMKKYGKISERTNRLVKKAGFQILKDDHGDYEVAAGKFESCNEDFEKVEIETDKEKMSMTAEENGKVIVITEPKEEIKEEEKAEVIEPVSDEVKAEFKTTEEESNEDKYVDIDIDEFDEEEFDSLGEQYLKRVYENVKSFKTTSGSINGNNLKLEGLITFKSGKVGKTNFIFEAKSVTKTGKLKFIGENKQFAKGKKSFILTGKMNGNKLITESFTYNYRGKDAKSGQSKRLYGRIVK